MSLPTDAKERKAVPIFSGVTKYFPRALAARMLSDAMKRARAKTLPRVTTSKAAGT